MAPLIALALRAILPTVAQKIASEALSKITPKQETQMDIILGLIRHALTAGGGVLVAKGYLDAGGAETVVGAIITLIGAVWSVWDKKKNPAV